MADAPMLSEELIAKVKNIQIRASHLANDIFAGEYESIRENTKPELC